MEQHAKQVLAYAALVVGLVGPLSAPAAAESTSAAPVPQAVQDGESTLTWSVRPTPTEAAPERPNYSYDLDPGATVEDSIRVRNFGTEPLPLAIYASDALTTSTGALDLLPAGAQPTGVGAWIVLDEAAIEVPPRGFVDVPFTMVVPAGTESGDHTGGIVTSLRTPGIDADGQTVVVDRRLGSRVQVRVSGPLHPQLTVTDVEVSYAGTSSPLQTGGVRVTYTVSNTGNVRLGAEQLLVVPGRLGLPGRVAGLAPMPELLPSHSLTFTIDVPDVWPTLRTTATVELRLVPTRPGEVFGPGTPAATGSAATWSIPWPQLAVLLAAALVVLWVWWQRRSRQRYRTALSRQAAQTAVIVQEAVRAVLAAQDSKTAAGEQRSPADEPMPTHGG